MRSTKINVFVLCVFFLFELNKYKAIEEHKPMNVLHRFRLTVTHSQAKEISSRHYSNKTKKKPKAK